jgi:tRNA A37 threonylcarbamoyladenosine modification protein TsaB
VATPDIVFARWRSIVVDGALIVAGEGALHYADRLQASLPSAECPEPVPALAPVIARLALRRAAAGGATGPHAIRPVYVRRPDAVLARERRAQAGTDRDPEGRRQ